MINRNILISGAGIAGTTLAYWLKKFGFNPTLLEISPKIRDGGYAIDFMGAGYDVAEKMGIVPELRKVDIDFTRLTFVDKNNNEKGSMNYQKIKEFLKGRAFTLLRSDLAKVIYNSLGKDVEIIFDDTINNIEQDDEKVAITFNSGRKQNFDLLIGADGLHSNVRKLVFGDEAQFEKYYGYYTSSYTIRNFSTGSNTFSMYNVPHKQVAIYSNKENQTTTFFVFTSPGKLSYDHHDIAKQKQLLENAFENCGWMCDELLSAIDDTNDFYFDPISQIQIEKWSKGRVSLVGDACYCPSLLSGKGSTLAMTGAYILAGELKQAGGDFKEAFHQYEIIFKPFMEKKQKAAQFFAKSFIPKTNTGIWLRNKAFKLMSVSIFSKLFLSQFKDSELRLKEY